MTEAERHKMVGMSGESLPRIGELASSCCNASAGCHAAPADGCETAAPAPPRAVLWLQAVTLVWMLVECGVALVSAWRAHSAALLAFGADSVVELFSGTVVLLQFAGSVRISRDRAARVAGWLLFTLAAMVLSIAAAGLVGPIRAEASGWGIAITIAALLVMPVLGWTKRRVARQTGDRALAADAVQSATCAYLAAVTLLGLAINAKWHVRWIDPAAALAAIPILVVEGRKALRGESCC